MQQITEETVKTVLKKMGAKTRRNEVTGEVEFSTPLMSLLPIFLMADPNRVNWDNVRTLDENWVKQLWAQVREEAATHKQN